MDWEGGDEAGVPGVGDGRRGGGAGGGTRRRDRGASSEVVSVTSSARKVSSNTIGLSNRTNEHPEGPGRDEEGVAAKSATIKRKVSAPAVRLVGTKGACETCKKAGVTTECAYGTGAACA